MLPEKICVSKSCRVIKRFRNDEPYTEYIKKDFLINSLLRVQEKANKDFCKEDLVVDFNVLIDWVIDEIRSI